MSELTDLTLVEAADRVARGEISARALTEQCIARAHALGPRLNCFVSLDADAAIAQAEQVDAHLARGGAPRPLDGVPLAHKDMFYRAGVVTGCGSKVRADFRPTCTATVLERLDGAGAVNLGGLHMAEFATSPTGHNAHLGACRNPWNPAHVTGGSSSGSGAAVAARLVFGALGSDTGGSIRLPAANCGLFGMKGTQTRVSRYGAMGLSYSLDNVGPLARSARDCARLFAVIAGHDPKDPTSARHPTADYEAATVAPDVSGWRIGIPSNYFYDTVTDEVRAALDASVAVFESLGAQPVALEVPHADAIGTIGSALSGVEALALHRAWLAGRRDDYGAQVRARWEASAAIPGADYLATMQVRPRVIRAFVEAVFSQCDVLHCPVLPMPVPTIEESDVGDRQGFEATIAALTRCTRPFNFLALPSLSVPAGFSGSGLPIGFQLVGRPFAEARLFRAGAAYEQATGWTRQAPRVPMGTDAS